MEIGQEWVYKGSQNLVTIIDIDHLSIVEVMFDSGRTKYYTEKGFREDFEPYAAKGQIWKLNGGYIEIQYTTDDAIRYSRNGEAWAYNKQDFFNKATRIL